jgi:hypothetical protein
MFMFMELLDAADGTPSVGRQAKQYLLLRHSAIRTTQGARRRYGQY